MHRRPNFQTIAWFNDIRKRETLDMNPRYQRRSVWNQRFKDYFIETILLNLPAPAIFLYQDISPDGSTLQHVVDGKQRLTAIFEFIDGVFPVADGSIVEQHRGKFFGNLPDEVKREFWSYILLVEYVPSDDDQAITSIFDRINRNTAKLTPQELRHARFSGEFITAAEALSEWMEVALPRGFPRIVATSRKQMKDVELVSYLLLLTEEGVKGYTQDDLDEAYSTRDESWDKRIEVENEFRTVISKIAECLSTEEGAGLAESRLRNQADFYSLYGAVLDLHREGALPDASTLRSRLTQFVVDLIADEHESKSKVLKSYLDAARSSSTDKGARDTRIAVVTRAIRGEQQ